MRKWPKVTATLFGGTDEHPWLRAQPKNDGDYATTPSILTAGNTALKTQPDGMFIRPMNGFKSLDVVCFEVCSSLPNLQDKRSRYSPSTASLIVETPAKWWNEPVHGNVSRWQKAAPPDEDDDTYEDDDWYPIRYIRIVYVLRKAHIDNFRQNGVAEGHEYFLRNRSLASLTSQKFQIFLGRLSPDNHFYTK